jgi:acyl-CoA thioesterase
VADNDRFEHLKAHANACAYYRHIGFEAVDVAEGFARLRMPVREELFQFQDAVHGGAIFSVADAAVAVALLSLAEPGEQALTIECKLNFLAGITRANAYVLAEGRIVHKGRTTALGEVDVKRDDGRLAAKGLVTYTLRRARSDA